MNIVLKMSKYKSDFIIQKLLNDMFSNIRLNEKTFEIAFQRA